MDHRPTDEEGRKDLEDEYRDQPYFDPFGTDREASMFVVIGVSPSVDDPIVIGPYEDLSAADLMAAEEARAALDIKGYMSRRINLSSVEDIEVSPPWGE